jgi:uncharacterized membrane protein
MTATSGVDFPATRPDPATAPPLPSRLTSLDLWRGAVMVLMAIDHVRVYSGVPAGGPTAGVFFTRWVTHFCAPGFVFLAGTAAFLYGRKVADRRELSRYLLTRGLLLVALELTVVRLSWTFTPASIGAPLAGVIWMLGWCMVLMSLLVRLPIKTIAILGLATMLAQDVFGLLASALPAGLAWVGQFVYTGGEVALGGITVTVLYSIVPWIGVMAAGYSFGALLLRQPEARRRACLRIGLTSTVAFLVLAGALVAFDGNTEMPVLFQLLNQRKYPASQLYLLMTLGPPIALLPFAEKARGSLARVLEDFGRVPMFYYLLHIPLIHLLALIAWTARDGQAHSEWFVSAPYVSVEPAARWGLPLLYLVFVIAVVILSVPCRWFARIKSQGRRREWLRYI